MREIIVTEEQDKVIKEVNSIHGGGMSDGYIVFRISQDIDLPVTTIARIVEGEEYEVEKVEKLKSILEQLRLKSENEIQFGESLFEQGDKENGQFREGLGRGVLFAITRIEKEMEK